MRTMTVIIIRKACAPTLRKIEAIIIKLSLLTILRLMNKIGTTIAGSQTDANSHKRCRKLKNCLATRVMTIEKLIKVMTKTSTLSGAARLYSHLSRNNSKLKNSRISNLIGLKTTSSHLLDRRILMRITSIAPRRIVRA